LDICADKTDATALSGGDHPPLFGGSERDKKMIDRSFFCRRF
jgi:hypothetical protein